VEDQGGGVLDVRAVPPGRREDTVVERFLALAPGESFTLVSDQDPRTLRARLAMDHSEAFHWDVLQPGSPIWRVRVERVS